MHGYPQRHRLTTSRCFTVPFNKAPLSPQPQTGLLQRPPLIYSTVRTPRSSTTTTSSSTAWQVGTHPPPPRINVVITPPEAATLHHSPRSHPLLHVQATGRYYNLAPLHGLTQDLSTTWLFSLQMRLLQHVLLSFEHIYAPPLDDTQQQHRQPIVPPHSCISSARLSHHQKLHPSTNPPPTLASASIVRAHTPPPTSISSSIVGHNSALRPRQSPSPFSMHCSL